MAELARARGIAMVVMAATEAAIARAGAPTPRSRIRRRTDAAIVRIG